MIKPPLLPLIYTRHGIGDYAFGAARDQRDADEKLIRPLFEAARLTSEAWKSDEVGQEIIPKLFGLMQQLHVALLSFKVKP